MDYHALLDFWYSDNMKKQWFSATPQLDSQIRDRFESLWQLARDGQLDNWQDTPEGALALCILLDQLPLNMYRNQIQAFSTEKQAIQVALQAIDNNFHHQLGKDKVSFLIMPLMHSENMVHQDLSVKIFTELDLKDNLRFAKHHRELIAEFGRFPHRNAILKRQITEAENQYLNSDRAFKG